MKPPRTDPKLAAAFAKDAADEAFLDRLNDLLAPAEEASYQHNLIETLPTIHVIGAPRTGTTLMTQLIATHLGAGCITNLAAAFWAAPVHGIRLSKHFFPRGINSNFHSTWGRTQGLMEPHEFGYFWTRILGHGLDEPADSNSVDWQRLKLVLLNMLDAYGRPIVFKSFQLAWHLPRMLQELPRTVWICMRRDPVQAASSVLRLRRGLSGDETEWVSIKPKEYAWLKDTDVYTQAAGQVFFTQRTLDQHIESVQGRNVLNVDYEELIKDPLGVLVSVRDLANKEGAELDILGDVPERFEGVNKPFDSTEARMLAQALNELRSR